MTLPSVPHQIVRRPDYLRPWMIAFAEWYALCTKRPIIAVQVAEATKLAGTPVLNSQLQGLKSRTDFRALVQKFYEGGVAAARTKIENDLPYYVDKHKEGLEQATKKKDYRAYKDFTVPMIERAWPRRESAVIATNITITLTPRQEAEFDLPREAIDAEVIDVEPADAPAEH